MELRNGELVFLKENVLDTFHGLHPRVPRKISRPFCVVIRDKNAGK